MQSSRARKSGFLGKVDQLLGKTATAIAAAAAAGLAGEARQADATIVYSGIVNINVPSTTAGVYLNVQTGQLGITPAASPGWDLNSWATNAFNTWANNSANPGGSSGVVEDFTGGSSATLVDNLPLNTLVDGSWTYGGSSSSETTGSTAFNVNSSGNYIGFKFFDEISSTSKFGWAHYSLDATTSSQPRTLIDYAYEDSGAGILVGATPAPEPTSLALLSLGAAGLAAHRRRRSRPARNAT